MDDTSLQLGLWEGCFYGFRKSFEAIDNGDQDVSDQGLRR